MAAFPKNLAKFVFDHWDNIVSGDYVAPPCPPLVSLRKILEACYLTSCAPEETRYPKFNVVATPRDFPSNSDSLGKIWKFQTPRPLTVSELHRLAPTVDLKKSTIWVTWEGQELRISGLVDLGTSWHRARVGLEYQYSHPSVLLIQVDRPGRLRIYQGAYHIATLVDGEIKRHEISINLFLHEAASAAVTRMQDTLDPPVYEHPRQYEDFEFIALVNTYIAIANAISLTGHGGMLVIARGDKDIDPNLVKLKYTRVDPPFLEIALRNL